MMTTQWNTRPFGANPVADALEKNILQENVVILMQGKNTFGDRIYSYLKLTVENLLKMQEAIKGGLQFNPSDFGTVVAAGKGEPTNEVKAEVAQMYKVVDAAKPASAATVAAPTQKAWDEY